LVEEFKNLKEFIVYAKEEVYEKMLERESSTESARKDTNKEDISELKLYHS